MLEKTGSVQTVGEEKIAETEGLTLNWQRVEMDQGKLQPRRKWRAAEVRVVNK